MALEAILDIGSSKVVCLIAGHGQDNRLEVHGMGYSEYNGLRRGAFLDPRSLREAVMTALDQAQSEARRGIRQITIGAPGPFVMTLCRKAEMHFEEPSQPTPDDVEALIGYSLENDDFPGYTRLHSVPVNYKLDGVSSRYLPGNAKARTFEALFAHCFLREEFKEILAGILEDADIAIDAFVDSFFAESLLLVPAHRQNDDSIVVDIGYYHTDVGILRNNALIFRKTLPIGGAHLASDISQVVGVSLDDAESIKRRHVFGLDYSHRSDDYLLESGGRETLNYEIIQNILEARANEMVDMIADELEQAPVSIPDDTPLILCGGGMSMMRGGREFIQSKLGLTVSTEMPPMPRRNSANITSAYGVVVYQIERNLPAKADWKGNAFMQSILRFFTK